MMLTPFDITSVLFTEDLVACGYGSLIGLSREYEAEFYHFFESVRCVDAIGIHVTAGKITR